MLKFGYDGPKPKFQLQIERSVEILAECGIPRVSNMLDENDKPFTVAVLPDEAAVGDLTEFYRGVDTRKRHRIQHLMSSHKAQARLQHLISYAPDRVAARYLAQMGNGAHIFFNTSPGSLEGYHRELATTNEETIFAHRHSRDLLPDPGVRKCLCGYEYTAPSADPSHPHSCKLNKKSREGCYGRHQRIVRSQCNNENEAGIESIALTKVNSNGRFNSTKVPDGRQSYNDGRGGFTDVTVRHPLAPSKVTRSVSHPLADLDDGECAKHAKYDDQCEQDGCSFTPLAINTYGGFGTEFLQHLNDVADHAEASVMCKSVRDDKTRGKFLYRMKQRLAVALQKGNADALRYAIKLSRKVVGGYTWGQHYQPPRFRRKTGNGNHAAALKFLQRIGLHPDRKLHQDKCSASLDSTVLYPQESDGDDSGVSSERAHCCSQNSVNPQCGPSLNGDVSGESSDRTQVFSQGVDNSCGAASPSLSDSDGLALSPIAAVGREGSLNMNCYNDATVQSDEDSGLCSQPPGLAYTVSPQSGTPPLSAGSVLLSPLLQANNSTFRVFTGPDLTLSDDDHMFPHSPSQGSNCTGSDELKPLQPAVLNVVSPISSCAETEVWDLPPCAVVVRDGVSSQVCSGGPRERLSSLSLSPPARVFPRVRLLDLPLFSPNPLLYRHSPVSSPEPSNSSLREVAYSERGRGSRNSRNGVRGRRRSRRLLARG